MSALKTVLSLRVSDDVKAEFLNLCAVRGFTNGEMLGELLGVYTRLQVSPQTPLPSNNILRGDGYVVDDYLAIAGSTNQVALPIGDVPDQVGLPHVKRSGTSTRAPRKSSQEKKEKLPAKFKPESFALAQAFYDALAERKALPEKRGWFMRQAAYAESMLKSGNITLQEALQCLSWALADEWWGLHLTSLNQLAEKVWPVYQRKKNAAAKTPQWMIDLQDWVDERNKED